MSMNAFIDIRISGDGLDLQEISSVLGIIPNYCYKKGDLRNNTRFQRIAGAHTEDCWIFGKALDVEVSLESQIERFIDSFAYASEFLRGLSSQYPITIWVSLLPETEQLNLHLSKNALNALCKIGATLDCSVMYLKEFYDGKS